MKLSEQQEKAYPYIKWLLSDNRYLEEPVGKTYLMSIIFIEQALEEPGEWIHIFDHSYTEGYTHEHMLKQMLNGIENRVAKIKDFKFEFDYDEFRFRCIIGEGFLWT